MSDRLPYKLTNDYSTGIRLKTNCSKYLDIYSSNYHKYFVTCLSSQSLRVLKRTVRRINSRLFWKASKRRISFHCFDAFIHCGFWSHPILDPRFSFRTIRQFPVNPNMTFTLEEWQSVLKLTSLYEMTQVKKFAIEKMIPLLTTLPALQIHLAKTYDIREWLAPGFLRLAHRIKPLDEEDVRLVGLTDSLKICALRENGKRCDRCRSRGVSLDEIGGTFGIHDLDLPDTVWGCRQTCVCPKSPEPVEDVEDNLWPEVVGRSQKKGWVKRR